MTTQWPTADDARPAGGAADPSGPSVDTGTGSVGSSDAADEDATHRTAVDAVDGLLDEVERALARLDDGTYGRCETCGEPIGDERLAELPVVRSCAVCEATGGVVGGPPSAPSPGSGTGPTESVTP